MCLCVCVCYLVYPKGDVSEAALLGGILHQLPVHGPELVKLICENTNARRLADDQTRWFNKSSFIQTRHVKQRSDKLFLWKGQIWNFTVNHTPKTSTRSSLKLAIDKFSALTNRKNVDWRFISIINLWMSCVVFCDSEENENDPAVFATAVTAITHLSFNFKDTKFCKMGQWWRKGQI